eukprot:7382406-Prymnesium_polylepis.2
MSNASPENRSASPHAPRSAMEPPLEVPLRKTAPGSMGNRSSRSSMTVERKLTSSTSLTNAVPQHVPAFQERSSERSFEPGV